MSLASSLNSAGVPEIARRAAELGSLSALIW